MYSVLLMNSEAGTHGALAKEGSTAAWEALADRSKQSAARRKRLLHVVTVCEW